MKLCDKCFSSISTQDVFCKECGAPVGDTVEEGSDAIVYPDLAKANLLRMKGDEAAAEQVCLAILKRFPNNPGAHVLLGDINTDLDKKDSARQWYEMALELMPENNSLREKLARLKPQTTTNLDTLQVPSGDRAAAAMAAFLALLVLVAALAFWLGNIRANANKNKLSDIMQPISVNGTAPPRTEEPKPADNAPIDDNTPTTQTPQNNMTENERALFAAVVTATGAVGKQLLHISMDTQSGVAIATAAVTQNSALQQQAIEVATIAASIIKNGANITRAKVRIVEPTSGKITFSAAATPTSISTTTAQNGTYEWAKAVLIDASTLLP